MVVDATYIKDHPEVYLVDVRTVQEYNGGHIPGAINIPYDMTGGTTAAETAQQFVAAGIKPNDPVILYCLSGVRAQYVAELLEEMDYTDVLVYVGSWNDWIADPSNPIQTD